MEIYFIIPLTIVGLLILLCGFKNLFSYEQVKEVKLFIKQNGVKTINTNNAYYSAIGQRKHYPSYPTRIFFTVADKHLIIYGISKFPFVFSTYSIPFIVSLRPNLLSEKLKLNRIFKLDYILI